MKVHVNINQDNIRIDEAFVGNNATALVGQMKARIASELGFAMRLAVNAMGELAFAQEVVKRLNQAKQSNLPIPNSCEEFLQLAQQQGFAVMQEGN